MNEKISLQDLVALLTEKSNIPQKDAEILVKECFDIMERGLINDKFLKIRSLGTFKLAWVEDRESVDVSTGEKVLIPAHYKVTFSPDIELSEMVNAPYASMEMTEINENEYHEKIEDALDDDDSDDEAEVEEEPEVMEIEKEKPEDKKEEKIENKGNRFKYEEEEEPEYNELYDDDNNRIAGINKGLFWFFVLIVSGLILLFAGRYFYSKIQTKAGEAISDSIIVFSTPIDRQESSDNLKTDQKTDFATKNAVDIQKKKSQTPTPLPATKPVATQQTQKTVSQPAKTNGNKQHTILKGERLNTIALREYGHKAFWVYIYDENREVIGNPDVVDPGTVVNIPPAKKYGIDKNNPESVNKALYLEQQYKKR